MIPRRFWGGLTFWVAACILFSLYFYQGHVEDPASAVAPVGQNNPPPPPPPEPEPETKLETSPQKNPEIQSEAEPGTIPEIKPETKPETESATEVKYEMDMEGKVIKDEQIFTYKDYSNETKFDPIEDNFPLGNSIQSRKDFPKIPSWNRPPATHVKEKTPLFIGFTRSVCISQSFLGLQFGFSPKLPVQKLKFSNQLMKPC